MWRWLSAIDYTSLQAWANALPTTLTTAVVASVWNNNQPITTSLGTPLLSLSGHTTTAVNNITIQPALGEGFAAALNPTGPFSSDFSSSYGGGSSAALAFNAANGVSIVLPATGVGGVNYISLLDSNVKFSGFQVQDPNPSSGSTILAVAQNVIVTGNIFDGYSQAGGASIIDGTLSGTSGALANFNNNLVVDRAPSGVSSAGTVNINYGGAFANNTFVAINTPSSLFCIINQSTTAVTTNVKNNIFVGYSAGDTVGSSGPATINVSYNVTTAASFSGTGVVPGSGNIYNATASALFVSPTTDFRLLASSAAVNAGTTDTTDIPAAIDIAGTSRPQGTAWDIGAYELPSAAAVGAAAGTSTVTGVGLATVRVRGTATGSSSVAGVSFTGNISTGTSAGTSTVVGVSLGPSYSVGTAVGISSAIAYSLTASVAATIAIGPVGSPAYETPFPVNGTYTIAPQLTYVDDTGTSFTAIPPADISSLGSTTFTFTHPGMPGGTHTLLIEDFSTSVSAAENYTVAGTSPTPTPTPSPTPAPVSFAATAFPPAQPTFIQSIIPAYLYQEYADDDDVQAFVTAYNSIAQSYLDWMRNINLPVYTGTQISGALLDWVAQGLYGIARPTLSFTQTTGDGPFDTYPLGFLPFAGSAADNTTTFYTVTDDIFKRIITWSFYKGDGKVFSVRWLKRRIARFLAGVNGTDYSGNTYQISVSFVGSSTINITISAGSIPTTYAPVLKAALLGGILPMPFQYAYNILLQ